MAKSDYEIIVIGGGAAGIAAARKLHDAGVDCLLVEARNRLGGRAYTIQASGYAIDLGCGWLHSADRNEWTGIAKAQGRDIDPSAPPWSRPAPPAWFPPDEQRAYRKEVDRFFEAVARQAKSGTDVAASSLLAPGSRWNPMINAMCTYMSGAECDRLSVIDLDRYQDTELNWRVPDGYGTVIVAHAAGVPVELECPVTRIDHSGARVVIDTGKGRLTAARVVVALPSPMIAEDTLFHPHLAAKAEAAAGVPLGVADKLFLTLDRAEEFDFDVRLYGRKDAVATANYQFRPMGRPMIEGYFGGSNAAALDRAGEQAYLDFALSELTAHFGSDFKKRISLLAIHRWAADPYARGSYSFALPGRSDGRAVLAAPVDDRIFFAGEACSRDDFSTAHGAYRTGVAAADRILKLRPRQR